MIGIVIIIVGLLVGNFIGWLMIRKNQHENRPFNWRVLIGPWTYYPWLDRKDK